MSRRAKDPGPAVAERSPVTVKDAAKAAVRFLRDLYEGDPLIDLRLEEVELILQPEFIDQSRQPQFGYGQMSVNRGKSEQVVSVTLVN